MSDREVFLAALAGSPVRAGDAIVVLCGEDGQARADLVTGLLSRNAARHVVLTGGKDLPPRLIGAERLFVSLVGKGVHPAAMIVDKRAQNTREQAVNMVALAREKEWTSLLLCASNYHAPRAFLTFVKALDEAGLGVGVRLVNVPTLNVPWFTAPPGADAIRADILRGELRKIEEYGDHVATVQRGLEYLSYWEGRP